MDALRDLVVERASLAQVRLLNRILLLLLLDNVIILFPISWNGSMINKTLNKHISGFLDRF